MNKVISFKVENHVYDSLKKQNLSFRELFEPYAIMIAKKHLTGLQYPLGIRNKEWVERATYQMGALRT